MDQKRKNGLKTLKSTLQGIIGDETKVAREKLRNLYDDTQILLLI